MASATRLACHCDPVTTARERLRRDRMCSKTRSTTRLTSAVGDSTGSLPTTPLTFSKLSRRRWPVSWAASGSRISGCCPA